MSVKNNKELFKEYFISSSSSLPSSSSAVINSAATTNSNNSSAFSEFEPGPEGGESTTVGTIAISTLTSNTDTETDNNTGTENKNLELITTTETELEIKLEPENAKSNTKIEEPTSTTTATEAVTTLKTEIVTETETETGNKKQVCVVCGNSFVESVTQIIEQYSPAFKESVKIFCAFLSLTENKFENGFTVFPLCPTCQQRIQLISAVVNDESQTLNIKLDELKEALESDLTRTYSCDSSDPKEGYDGGHGRGNSEVNEKRGEDRANMDLDMGGGCYFFSPRKFREQLQQELKFRTSSVSESTSRTASSYSPPCSSDNSSSDDVSDDDSDFGCESMPKAKLKPESAHLVFNDDNKLDLNAKSQFLTVTVIPSDLDADQTFVEFQGVDAFYDPDVNFDMESLFDEPPLLQKNVDSQEEYGDVVVIEIKDGPGLYERDDFYDDFSDEIEGKGKQHNDKFSKPGGRSSSSSSSSKSIRKVNTRSASTKRAASKSTSAPAPAVPAKKNKKMGQTRETFRDVVISKDTYRGRRIRCPHIDPVHGRCNTLFLNQPSLDRHMKVRHTSVLINEDSEMDSAESDIYSGNSRQNVTSAEDNNCDSATAGTGTGTGTDSLTVKKRAWVVRCTFIDPRNGRRCNTYCMDEDQIIQRCINHSEKKTNNSKKPRLDSSDNNDSKDTQKTLPVSDSSDLPKPRKTVPCTFIDPISGTCSWMSTDEEHRDAHINRRHLKINTNYAYQCKSCPVGLPTYEKLMSHKKIHSGMEGLKCEKCDDESFEDGEALLYHKRRYHDEPYEFVCGICNKGFSGKYSLRYHELRHSKEFQFRCHVGDCKASFRHKSLFDTHMLSHPDEHSFSCENCPRKYLTEADLDLHKKVHSPPAESLTCDANISSHEMSSQSLPFKSEPQTTISKAETLLFNCPQCDFKAEMRTDLISHIKSEHLPKKEIQEEISTTPIVTPTPTPNTTATATSPEFEEPVSEANTSSELDADDRRRSSRPRKLPLKLREAQEYYDF